MRDSSRSVLVGPYLLLQYRNQLLAHHTDWIAVLGTCHSKDKEHLLFYDCTCADQFAWGCVSALRQTILMLRRGMESTYFSAENRQSSWHTTSGALLGAGCVFFKQLRYTKSKRNNPFAGVVAVLCNDSMR